MITRCTKGDLIVHFKFEPSMIDPVDETHRTTGTCVCGLHRHKFNVGDEVILRELSRNEYGSTFRAFEFSISRLFYDKKEATCSILNDARKVYTVIQKSKRVKLNRYTKEHRGQLRRFKLHREMVAYCYDVSTIIPMWIAYPINEAGTEDVQKFVTIPEAIMLCMTGTDKPEVLCCTGNGESGKSVRTISRRGVYHV